MPELVPVKLLQRLQVQHGGLLHPGEVVGLPAAQAQDLIDRGGAVAIARAPDTPPLDKMVRGGRTVKK